MGMLVLHEHSITQTIIGSGFTLIGLLISMDRSRMSTL